MTLRRICVWGFSLLLAAGPLASQQKVELLFPGNILGDGPWPGTGETWLRLFRTGPGFRLAPARIKVEQIPDACAGTATEISADTTPIPYLLLKGPGIQAGPVDTAFAGNQYLYPGQSISIKMEKPERWSSLLALGTAISRPGDILVKNYTVALNGLVFVKRDVIAMENTPRFPLPLVGGNATRAG